MKFLRACAGAAREASARPRRVTGERDRPVRPRFSSDEPMLRRALNSGPRLLRVGASQLPSNSRLATARALHAGRPAFAETVKITFIEDGEEIEVDAEIGKSLLEVAHANEIDLEGACDGSLACSTCHLILTQDVFDSLEPPEEEEEDMLDLAFDLTDTSRLGCQITVTKELEGMVARIPSGTNDMRPP